MTMDFRVPLSEIEIRIKRAQKVLQEQNIEGLLIMQRVDLFYFSGTAQNGILYLPAQEEPLLMIKKYLPRAKKESAVKRIIPIRSSKEIPGLILDYYGRLPDNLGFELDVLPVNSFEYFRSIFKSRKYLDGSPVIHNIRMIKSPWEIEQMEKTADLSLKTFEYIQSAIRPGLTELEFSGMYETFSRRHGHQAGLRSRDFLNEGYAWHILSGKNGGIVGLLDSPASGEGTSAAFPCGGGHKLLEANEPIMIDFGTVLNGYHIDETRMFAIESMPDREMKACEASINIHDAVLEKVKPGITLDELYQVSVEKARDLGYDDQYLGPRGNKVVFIGHGIGLELVEPPIIAKGREIPLKPGMTFSLEPKMVFENEFAAGIEDVFVVTETGYRMISKLPKKIFVC